MFKIGNVVIDVKQKENNNKLDVFRCPDCEENYRYEVMYIDKINAFNKAGCVYLSDQLAVILENNEFIYYHKWNEFIYAVVKKVNNTYNVYLDKSYLETQLHPYFIPSLFHLEIPLLEKNCFILHSSYIGYQNKGILFTAPSGGGKSTQAELWHEYMNADILNGDKSIVGLKDNKFYSYGIPFSGSSNYCVNQTLPLGAIVVLLKGPTNQIQKVGMRGFRSVYSQVTVNPWDKEYCEKLMDLVLKSTSQVPIYVLSCTKDEGAVDCLYEQLIKDGVY